MLGVAQGEPVPSEDPPDGAAYQVTVPAEPVAPRLAEPVPHLTPGVVPVMLLVKVICNGVELTDSGPFWQVTTH